MTTPRKITLAEAADSGAVALTIACAADPVSGPGCRRTGAMPLGAALERFGPDARLDALPFVCSACGSRVVDVRPCYDTAPGREAPEAALLIDAWRSRPPGARQ